MAAQKPILSPKVEDMKGPRTKTRLRGGGGGGVDEEEEGKEKLSSIAPQNRNNQSRLSYDYGNERGGKEEGRKEGTM